MAFIAFDAFLTEQIAAGAERFSSGVLVPSDVVWVGLSQAR